MDGEAKASFVPIEKNQVMAAEALLAHCQTVAIPREPDEEILIDEEPLK